MAGALLLSSNLGLGVHLSWQECARLRCRKVWYDCDINDYRCCKHLLSKISQMCFIIGVALTLGINYFVGSFLCWAERRKNNSEMASTYKPSCGSRIYTVSYDALTHIIGRACIHEVREWLHLERCLLKIFFSSRNNIHMNVGFPGLLSKAHLPHNLVLQSCIYSTKQ